jgi:hypothetical protein
MDECSLVRIAPCVHLRSHGRDYAECRVADEESPVVARGVKHGEGALEELVQGFRNSLRLEAEAVPSLDDSPAELAYAVACS